MVNRVILKALWSHQRASPLVSWSDMNWWATVQWTTIFSWIQTIDTNLWHFREPIMTVAHLLGNVLSWLRKILGCVCVETFIEERWQIWMCMEHWLHKILGFTFQDSMDTFVETFIEERWQIWMCMVGLINYDLPTHAPCWAISLYLEEHKNGQKLQNVTNILHYTSLESFT